MASRESNRGVTIRACPTCGCFRFHIFTHEGRSFIGCQFCTTQSEAGTAFPSGQKAHLQSHVPNDLLRDRLLATLQPKKEA